MGIRSKIFGRNAKILPGSMAFNQTCDSDSDDSASTDMGSIKSSSFASTRTHSRASSAVATPRKRPVVDISSPTSSSSRRSAWESPASLKSPRAPSQRKKSNARNDLSHLIGPTQPWNEYIQGYVTNMVEKVGGTQEAWTNVLSLRTGDVRATLILNGIPLKGSNKPRQLPQEIQKVLKELLDSMPPDYRNDTAKLTFALHERPFYCTALEKHVELVLWAIVSARNAWM
eukprot:gnl/MRDRNA2_/MRDRNA2_52134_c0_seq1.p1 gnl/MRDRNA2_/MRDRNA2_52134_c0~~gnl/MRDRNA2_/MRDRNA2_52134_c0_seq1.p1  ORF type:complete len:229 (-),score=33.33 gnl/MRDRNA2_/MRDRNA2_52134_c0_seq1:616-1302(-)